MTGCNKKTNIEGCQEVVSMELKWVPSKYNNWARLGRGTVVIYNGLTGAFMRFKGQAAQKLIKLMQGKVVSFPKNLTLELASRGFLVPDTTNEFDKLNRLADLVAKEDETLQLILMPTEECNFRCSYCYEKFKKGKMRPSVANSIVRLVERHLPKLRSLSVLWFGGEPLIAIDTIEEISRQLIDLCKEYQTTYSASMSTNGYLLTEEIAERCLSASISKFQVTLDGPPEIHDKMRVLINGDGTFSKILANLRCLHQNAKSFQVRIRVNFTVESMSTMSSFLRSLGKEFAGDPRFSIYFRPVGQWGEKKIRSLSLCDSETSKEYEIELMSMALQEGFGMDSWKESIQLLGSICYASYSNSFVIGPDGSLYKCTVAFDDQRNQIGKLRKNGTLDVKEELSKLWTASGEDSECKKCAFFPACLGKTCPLERLNGAKKTCSLFKTHIEKCLCLLASEVSKSGKMREETKCQLD